MREPSPILAATPPALAPAQFAMRHRWRLFRARRRGVVADGRAYLGRGVEIAAPVRLGADAVIGDGCRIVGPVTIGAGTVVGEKCRLIAQAGITLGRGCLLGDGVAITDFEPVVADVERPVREQGLRAIPVKIGDGARLAHGACIGPGGDVRPGAAVGAHLVVPR